MGLFNKGIVRVWKDTASGQHSTSHSSWLCLHALMGTIDPNLDSQNTSIFSTCVSEATKTMVDLPHVLDSSSTLAVDPFLNNCFAAVTMDTGLPSFEFIDQTLLRLRGLPFSLISATMDLVTDGRPTVLSVPWKRRPRLKAYHAYADCRLLQCHY